MTSESRQEAKQSTVLWRGSMSVLEHMLDGSVSLSDDDDDETSKLPLSLGDLRLGKHLGEGANAVVRATVERGSGRVFALKILDKMRVKRSAEEIKNVFREKTLLSKLRHPFVMKLYKTAQDASHLYFLLEFCAHGELYSHIRRVGRFDEPVARFYTAELLEALCYLHANAVVHRDVKPENILLDHNWHIRLSDFETAKEIASPSPSTSPTADLSPSFLLDQPSQSSSPSVVQSSQSASSLLADDQQETSGRLDEGLLAGQQTSRRLFGNKDDDEETLLAAGLVNSSFVGTAHYLSPEMLLEDKVSGASDLWALGCVLYQMLVGHPPFTGGTDYVIFKKIRENDFSFPDGLLSPDARHLIGQLLQHDPRRRYTAEQIRQHRWFAGFDWTDLHLQSPPPIVAPISVAAVSPPPSPTSSSTPPTWPFKVRVRIRRHEIVPAFRPYTNYIIKLSLPAHGLRWRIVQRYSELHQLDAIVRGRFPAEKNLPKFPAKKFQLFRVDEALIVERKAALETYLQRLFAMPAVLFSQAVRQRFSFPAHLFPTSLL